MNFKLAIAAFFTLIFSIFKLFNFIGKAKEDEIRADAEEEARLVQNQAWVEIKKGRKREQKEVDKPVDVKNRTDFE